MRRNNKIWPFGLALIVVVLATSSARAECDTFPKVPWWGNLTHVTANTFVFRKYKGKWAPYIKKWSKQADKLEDVHKRESSVFVRYKGKKVKIAGKALANYIKLVKKRVSVNRCLAKLKTDRSIVKASEQ